MVCFRGRPRWFARLARADPRRATASSSKCPSGGSRSGARRILRETRRGGGWAARPRPPISLPGPTGPTFRPPSHPSADSSQTAARRRPPEAARLPAKLAIHPRRVAARRRALIRSLFSLARRGWLRRYKGTRERTRTWPREDRLLRPSRTMGCLVRVWLESRVDPNLNMFPSIIYEY